MNTDNSKQVPGWKIYTGLAILIAPIAFAGWWCLSHYFQGDTKDFYTKFIFMNYTTFFLVPYSAFFALYLVSVLESSRGPVEFELLGMKVKGAGGPILFWVLIFLCAVFALKLLWVPPTDLLANT